MLNDPGTAVIADITTKIGKAAALRLASEGYRLVLCSLRREQVDQRLLRDLDDIGCVYGLAALCFQEEEQVKRLADSVREAEIFGKIKVFFYNILPEPDRDLVSQCSIGEFSRMIDCHVTSLVSAAKVMGSSLTDASLIFLGSVHGEKPTGAAPLYSMYMGAVKNMVREAAFHFGRRRVRCNCIELGAMGGEDKSFKSPISKFYEGYPYKIPTGHVPTESDIAEIVSFLASDRSRAVNGEEIRADGGLILEYLDPIANRNAYERISEK